MIKKIRDISITVLCVVLTILSVQLIPLYSLLNDYMDILEDTIGYY